MFLDSFDQNEIVQLIFFFYVISRQFITETRLDVPAGIKMLRFSKVFKNETQICTQIHIYIYKYLYILYTNERLPIARTLYF